MANGKTTTGKWTHKGQEIPELSEDAARAYLEKLRWPDGPHCVHCGSDQVYKLGGDSTRPGLLKCRACKGQFTVAVGTIFEDSHIPLAKWVKAFHLMATSKKGMSALQLQRNLGLGSYRSAWHMAHRIRFAMSNPEQGMLKGTVEVDETYVGGKPRPGTGYHKRGRGTSKAPVVVLVERDGNARSHPVERVDAKCLKGAILECVHPSASINTDELSSYTGIGENFSGGHQTVNHGQGQYVGDNGEHTNTAESYFSLLKRGVYGTFHHVSKKHLHRYCDEFSFRWNGRKMSDSERRETALKQVEGKRLYYHQPAGEA